MSTGIEVNWVVVASELELENAKPADPARKLRSAALFPSLRATSSQLPS